MGRITVSDYTEGRAVNKLSLFLGALLIGVPLVVTFNNYSVHDYIARIQIISPSVAAEHLKSSAADSPPVNR